MPLADRCIALSLSGTILAGTCLNLKDEFIDSSIDLNNELGIDAESHEIQWGKAGFADGFQTGLTTGTIERITLDAASREIHVTIKIVSRMEVSVEDSNGELVWVPEEIRRISQTIQLGDYIDNIDGHL
ncbi:hypothetical protein FRC07_005065, partial [Ceratobasidium sp. 392]